MERFARLMQSSVRAEPLLLLHLGFCLCCLLGALCLPAEVAAGLAVCPAPAGVCHLFEMLWWEQSSCSWVSPLMASGMYSAVQPGQWGSECENQRAHVNLVKRLVKIPVFNQICYYCPFLKNKGDFMVWDTLIPIEWSTAFFSEQDHLSSIRRSLLPPLCASCFVRSGLQFNQQLFVIREIEQLGWSGLRSQLRQAELKVEHHSVLNVEAVGCSSQCLDAAGIWWFGPVLRPGKKVMGEVGILAVGAFHGL